MIPDETIIKFQLKTAKTSSELNNKDFIGPEGTTKSYYTNTNEPIWDGHNGDRWLQFKINLNISILTESPTLNDVNITYNCIPETRIVVPTNGTIITINKPVFKWEFLDVDSDSQAAFQVQIDNESTFDEVDYDSLEQSTSVTQWQFPSGTSFSSLPEGTWYWKVRTKDYDDRWSDYTSPSVLIIDSSPPITAITFPINNGFFNGAGNINGIALDGLDGSGVSKTEIAIKRLSDNYYWNVYNWFPLETWLMVTGTTEWSYSSEQISWTNNDQYTIQSRAIDKINNMETPTKGNTITIDLIAPKTTINTPINNTWTNNIESIIGESDDYEGSGIDEISITIKSIDSNRYWNGLGWDNQKNSINIKLDEDNSWSFDTSAIQWGCGYYLASVQALDNANNTELPVARNFFMFDDVLPIPTSISINDGAIYTNNSQVIFSLFAEDLHSGVHQMSFNVDNIGWSEWESFSTLQKYNLTTSDGLKEVYFRVKDHAGNIGGNIYDAIILDATPPEQLSMMINNDAGFANSEIVSVELSAVDFISGIKDMAFSTNGNDWSPWELFNPTKHINLPDGDGEKILYFKIRDNANNIAETSKSIIIDKTPPHSLTVQINNGSSETNTNLVKLSLNSIDNLSGVDKFSLSIDGNRWSSWENFTKETSFTFTEAEGTKTIYFKVKDHAGNIAEPVSTTITYKIAEVPQEQEGTKKFIGQNIWLLFLLIIIIIVILFITLDLIIKRAPKPKYDYTTQPKPVEKPSGYYHGSQRPRMPGSGSETTIITPDRYKTMDARDQYTNVVSTPTISTIPQTTTTTAPTDAVSVSLLEKQAGSQQTREKPNKTFNEGAATTTISDSVPGPEPKLFDTPQLPPGSDQTTPTITPAVATTPTPTPKVRSTQMEPDLISSLDELDDDSWMETSTNSSAPSTSEVSIPKTELDEIEDIQIPESETSEENVIENQSTQVDEIELQTQATYKPGITPDKITKKKHDDFDYDEEWRDQ